MFENDFAGKTWLTGSKKGHMRKEGFEMAVAVRLRGFA